MDIVYSPNVFTNVIILTNCFVFYVNSFKLFVSSELVHGCPKHTFVASFPVLVGLFPAVLLAAYNRHPDSFYQFLFAQWTMDRPYELEWICLLLAHFMKDFFTSPLSLELILHHLVSITLASAVLYKKDAQPGVVCFGGMLLELGSATFILYCLYPKSKQVRWLYKWGMTLSNTATLLTICAFVHNNRERHLYLALSTLPTILCIFRQKYMLKYVNLN